MLKKNEKFTNHSQVIPDTFYRYSNCFRPCFITNTIFFDKHFFYTGNTHFEFRDNDRGKKFLMRDIQSQILAKFCRQLDNEELLFRKMQSVSKSEMSLIWFIKISIEHNVMSRLEQQKSNRQGRRFAVIE